MRLGVLGIGMDGWTDGWMDGWERRVSPYELWKETRWRRMNCARLATGVGLGMEQTTKDQDGEWGRMIFRQD